MSPSLKTRFLIALLLPVTAAWFAVGWLLLILQGGSADWPGPGSHAIGIFVAAAIAAALTLVLVVWWADRHLFSLLRRSSDALEEQRKATATLQRRYDSVLEGLSEAVLIVDGTGRIVSANSASRRIFPSRGEICGRDLRKALAAPELIEQIQEVLTTDGSRQLELEAISPRSQVLSASVHPLQPDRGAVIIVEDRTRMTHLATVRRDLVANVSHEIKTPLAAIRGYAETLQDGALDDPAAAAGFLTRILRQCRRLQAILDDLLTLSRVESPEAVRGRDDLDLQLLLDWAADLVRDEARLRQIDLTIDPGPPCPLSGEREALERLLINLLDNAIKYNRPGGKVRAGIASRDRQIVLEVSDTGIGIPPTALGRVFERFYRVDRARSREEGGTGLGLAIVQHAAYLHGGRVEVESRPGEGSTFRVVLPGGAGSDLGAR